jgi:hypothetical protein
VARELAALTGFRLFQNHLTVDPMAAVFPRLSPAFGPLVHRLRRELFATTAREDVDLVLTSVYAHPEDAPAVRALMETVLAVGGRAPPRPGPAPPAQPTAPPRSGPLGD